jgi:hypothetical protein
MAEKNRQCHDSAMGKGVAQVVGVQLDSPPHDKPRPARVPTAPRGRTKAGKASATSK